MHIGGPKLEVAHSMGKPTLSTTQVLYDTFGQGLGSGDHAHRRPLEDPLRDRIYLHIHQY